MTRDRLPHHRPRFGGFGRVVLAAAVLAVSLSGCASTGPAPGEEPPAGTSSTGTPQPGEMVPTGFPEGFDCDAVARLIPELTTGLHLGFRSEPEEEYDTQLGCGWYDVPLEEGQRPVDLDSKFGVAVSVTFNDDMDADVRERWCGNDIRGKNPLADEILNGHGQCGGGSFADDDDHSLGAWAPYFSLTIGTTCQHPRRACSPVVPASVTDEAGFTALRTIADHLTTGTTFTEETVVSEADNEADFVRDWGEAGFPGLQDAPDWYCHPALYDTISDYVLHFQGTGLDDDVEWRVADEVNRKPAIPEATLTAGQTSFTIQVVLGNSTRCISGIEHADAG